MKGISRTTSPDPEKNPEPRRGPLGGFPVGSPTEARTLHRTTFLREALRRFSTAGDTPPLVQSGPGERFGGGRGRRGRPGWDGAVESLELADIGRGSLVRERGSCRREVISPLAI